MIQTPTQCAEAADALVQVYLTQMVPPQSAFTEKHVEGALSILLAQTARAWGLMFTPDAAAKALREMAEQIALVQQSKAG